MTKVTTKLSDQIVKEFKEADEIWVAVALINLSGLKFIRDNISKQCIQNYLIGIDLPTDPKALKLLYDLQFKVDLKVRIYSEREYFHPKLYLLRKGNFLNAFVGSGNCTNGGLNSNIELAVNVKDTEACSDIKNWFNKLYEKAKPMTLSFISKYEEDYKSRIEKKREDEKIVEKEKEKLNEDYDLILTQKSNLIKTLKAYRKEPNYEIVKEERKVAVDELRKSLDYPNFKNIDVDKFFSIWDLGHIISLPKPTIKKEIKKFIKLLFMLCDEMMDISIRYNKALDGDLKIRGINEGMISKVLVVHKPELYFVKNSKSIKALNKYGLDFPRGLSKGEKYKITSLYLRQICNETNIEDLAILDHYLYLEGNI